MSREVEEDNFLAGQGLVRGHRASVGAVEVLARQKFHDECEKLKWKNNEKRSDRRNSERGVSPMRVIRYGGSFFCLQLQLSALSVLKS